MIWKFSIKKATFLNLFVWFFVEPTRLFRYIKDNPKSALIAIVSIFLSLMVLFAIKPNPMLKSTSHEFSNLYPMFFFMTVIAFLTVITLETLLISMIVKFLKVTVNFRTSFTAFFYCRLPYLLENTIFVLFPILLSQFLMLIIIIVKIWEIVLSIIAISVIFNFSYKKSILVYLPLGAIEIFLFIRQNF